MLQLKRLGHDVTVVDRNSGAGLGSTSASSAVVRFNYSTFDAVALAWESYFLWKEFKALIDGTNNYSKNRALKNFPGNFISTFSSFQDKVFFKQPGTFPFSGHFRVEINMGSGLGSGSKAFCPTLSEQIFQQAR